MENKKKKPYVKPRLTRIKIDAKCAVLSVCKTSGARGPRWISLGCHRFVGGHCRDAGS